MKTLSYTLKLLTLLTFVFLSLNCFAQELTEKSFFDSNKEYGGDVIIIKSIMKIEENESLKTFEIEAPENDYYYMNAWVSGAELENFGSGKFVNYDLIVNGVRLNDKFTPLKSNWHNASYKNANTSDKKAIKLNKGLNQITFSYKTPLIPEIDFIRLSKEKDESEISDTKYSQYYSQTEYDMANIATPISVEDSLYKLRNGNILLNPEGNYYHHIDATYKYTYYTTVYFTAGQQVFIATSSNSFKHVLELFSVDNPQSYSWTTISNSNSLASFNLRIPSSGLYYIKVRAWTQSQQGFVNLNINGQHYYTNCIAAGYAGFRHFVPPGEFNHFTCKIIGDTRIWFEDNNGFPGRIVAYNDDYSGTGDFSWGLASRVKKNFTTQNDGFQFSAYSSYNPTGICDYYIKCMSSNVMPFFPNLEAEDAIQSAPATNAYNCISWSGGIVFYWEWPPSQYSDYYVPENPLASFDAFYSINPRPGCEGATMTYTRNGATESNSIVDLWELNGSFTHASVTEPANYHPHGYDWESKPGSLMRTFHPRYSLNGSSYGSVTTYYRQSYTIPPITLAESIALGKSVIENVTFTENEKTIISKGINTIEANVKENFENKYNTWKKTWIKPEIAIHSNPSMYAQSDEYNKFIDFCKNQNETIWLLIFDRFSKGDFFAINALTDLTLSKNQHLLDKVKEEGKKNSITESGATIIRSPQTYAMRYIKELLKSPSSDKSPGKNGIFYSNSFGFNVFPNPVNTTSQILFTLPQISKVSINVIDLKGQLLSVIIDEQMLPAGNHIFKLQLPTDYKGACLIILIIDGTVHVKKLIVQ